MQEWEEPHPGRRLSCPADTPTEWVTYIGDGRGGMAAKGQRPRGMGFDSARRSSDAGGHGHGHNWHRNVRGRNLPKQLIITCSSHDEKPEIHTAPLPRSRAELYGSTTIKQNAIMEATTHELDGFSADLTDNESDTTMVSPSPETSACFQDSPAQGLQFTDFSNYLGDCMDTDDTDHSSFTLGTDTDLFSGRASDEDLYGWDAVMDRRFINPFEDSVTASQSRRGSRSKRSLLQRVLSSGGLSARNSLSDSSGPYSFADGEAPPPCG
ncbi:hypothetical protein J7T55_006866 [Diaporthe amygdali]|uniref:uncharacterized protein n=1 Tax=Phomopsis amygdali TaxID=1214568 RepID=UPI0022FEB6CC|nr:uncharacterized protein J7T55_006866 [Diaporthe amygdali]KAJ0125517.1 hypothetical protein J7T55_006866 [Diaporthe amygdali]